jgi:chorismate mutase
MAIRGIRGATQASANTHEAIDAATRELLTTIVTRNKIEQDDIVSVFLTATVDLDAAYPAAAARKMGWTDIPLLDAQEIDVQNGLNRVIRVLMHVETELPRARIHHVYLGEAAKLRPDLAGK